MTLPYKLTSIEIDAFQYCRSLSMIDVSLSLACIGRDTFSGCLSLATVTIPSDITTLGNNAFYGYLLLTTLILPASISIIGLRTFDVCTPFALVNFEVDPIYLSIRAFKGCKLITINAPSLSTITFNTSHKEFEKVLVREG